LPGVAGATSGFDPVRTSYDCSSLQTAKRFPESGGWGYALFNYDATTDKFTADPSPADCGHTCHVAVKAKDHIFHPYQKR
jgi:Cytochrome P460